MYHTEHRPQEAKKIGMKIIDTYVKGKDIRPSASSCCCCDHSCTYYYSKVKVHGTVANLPGLGHKREFDDKLKRQIIKSELGNFLCIIAYLSFKVF